MDTLLSQNDSKAHYHAGVGTALFFIMSLPGLYNKTNSYYAPTDVSSCPTYKSKILHTVIFFILAILAMKYVVKSTLPTETIVKNAVYATLLFFFVSSAELHSLTQAICNSFTSVPHTVTGCPKMSGVVLHSALYYAALYAVIVYNK